MSSKCQTKDLIAFMREEMDNSREHEPKLVGLLQIMCHFKIHHYFYQLLMCHVGEGSLLSTTNYPTWNIAIGGPSQPTAHQNSHVGSRTAES